MDFLFATVKFSRSLHTYKRTYTRHKSFSGSWSHFQGPYTHANTHTNTLTQTHWHNNTVQVIFRVVVAVFGRLPVPVAKHSQVSFPLSLSVRPSFPCLSLPVSVPVCLCLFLSLSASLFLFLFLFLPREKEVQYVPERALHKYVRLFERIADTFWEQRHKHAVNFSLSVSHYFLHTCTLSAGRSKMRI